MQKSLWNRGFIALLITQFMVSFNDNVFRWLIIPIGKYCEGWNDPEGHGQALILSLGAVTFLLPFIVFTPYAGFCTDRFDRRKVMISCKVAEIVFLIGGIFAILAQSVPAMLTVLCLLGVQGAFFSPSKYGSLPDLVPPEKLTAANGVIGMTTMIAVVGGQVFGGVLFTLTTQFGADGNPANLSQSGLVSPWIWIVSLLGVAVLGWLSSLFVTPLPVADATAKFPVNPAAQICKDIYTLAKHRWIFIPALGSAFFWGVGALSQTNIDLYSQRILQISQVDAMYLIAILSAGIALGSVLAGLISRKQIELGLVPIGAFGIVVCGFLLAFTPEFSSSPDQKRVMARVFVEQDLEKVEQRFGKRVIDYSDPTDIDIVMTVVLNEQRLEKREKRIQEWKKTQVTENFTIPAEIFSDDDDGITVKDFYNNFRGAPMTTFGFIYGAICLFLLGTFAGMYDIPMISYIQQQSPPELRGRILAATNFFSFSSMLLFAGGVFLLLSSGFGLNANQIWFVMSFMVLLVAVLLAIHFRVALSEFIFRKRPTEPAA